MDIQPVNPPRRSILRLWPWLFVLLVVLVMAFIRFRLLDLPLERDEGEYACAGQLLLQGIPPYKLAWNMKLPGTYFAYALGMSAFGQTCAGIHATLIAANSVTIVLVFLLGRKLFGTIAGLAACSTYGVLSASPAVLGLAAHANHFVVLFAVWGALALWKAEENYRGRAVLFSGVLFGLAFLMKQQGICFCIFAVAVVVWNAVQNKTLYTPVFFKKIIFLGIGMLLPFAVLCLYLLEAGVFSKFWFWTFGYARAYTGEQSIGQGIGNFLRYTGKAWPVYLADLALVSASLPFVMRARALHPQIIFAGLFLFFSVFGTSIDLYFRPHYFILSLPALAILTGLAIVSLQIAVVKTAFKIVPPAVCVLFLGWSLFQQRQVFFQLRPEAVIRTIYTRDTPFADMPAVGGYIRDHSAPNATVAIVGSEPEIYFYARRRPATGYLYTYPLIEGQRYKRRMRAEMINQIETNKPEFLVFVNYVTSGNDPSLDGWFMRFAGANYSPVAVMDQRGWGKTAFLTGDRLKDYCFTGTNYVGIFRIQAEPSIAGPQLSAASDRQAQDISNR